MMAPLPTRFILRSTWLIIASVTGASLLNADTAAAKIGAQMDDCQNEYGPPQSDAPAMFPATVAKVYIVNNWQLTVEYCDGVAEAIIYAKKDGSQISSQSKQGILDGAAEGHDWIRDTSSDSEMYLRSDRRMHTTVNSADNSVTVSTNGFFLKNIAKMSQTTDYQHFFDLPETQNSPSAPVASPTNTSTAVASATVGDTDRVLHDTTSVELKSLQGQIRKLGIIAAQYAMSLKSLTNYAEKTLDGYRKIIKDANASAAVQTEDVRFARALYDNFQHGLDGLLELLEDHDTSKQLAEVKAELTRHPDSSANVVLARIVDRCEVADKSLKKYHSRFRTDLAEQVEQIKGVPTDLGGVTEELRSETQLLIAIDRAIDKMATN
jgi:hypothetical protein